MNIPSGKWSSLLTSLAVVVALVSWPALADDTAISVPVKLVSNIAPEPNPAMATDDMTPPAQPTTPGGKLPQYQLGHLRRTIRPFQADNPRLRFLLTLPDFPVLVEATVTVDGKPFGQLREQRVTELMKLSIPSNDDPSPSLSRSTQKQATPETDSSDAAKATNDELTAANDEPSEQEIVDITALASPTANSAAERIRRYIAATGETPSADEVRWQLTNWVDGPVLLFLNDNFQRFRADQIPVFRILDRDRDGRVSKQELLLATKSFNECDLNRDDIVQQSEIAEVTSDPRDVVQHAGPGKLIFSIPSPETAEAMYGRLVSQYTTDEVSDELPIVPRFDLNSNGKFEANELAHLTDRDPDVALTIEFQTGDAGASKLALTSVAAQFQDAKKVAVVRPQSLSIKIGPTQVIFSAIQTSGSDQISIGAVNDGYPLLPALDPNQDGQFTIRELRELNKRLAGFDHNQDGELTADENRSPIRLCIGLGPGVHRELAVLRTTPVVNQNVTQPTVDRLEWFSQMDINNDNDLTRKEFPGTDEQFATLDADNDKLVSAAEASAFQKSQDKAEKN